jgi:simple sugar transport system ATP-binding protein
VLGSALDLRGVSKTFPGGVRAVRDADLAIEAGEIHALCGENGAGKTTLALIAAGKLKQDAGEVSARGNVGLVHQHFELVERLRVWENVVLGAEPHRGVRMDARAARERVRSLSRDFGLHVEPDALVEDLPIGVQQRVELLRELSREPAILILDEPTSVLAPAEIDSLFETVRALAARGTAVLIITHKLAEVVAHTQRVTVMRAGAIVARMQTSQVSIDDVAHAMVGGEIPPLAARTATETRPALAVRDLHAGNRGHGVRGVSLEVRGGEIVGIAGVEGNGQSALADAIAGVLPYEGTIELAGRVLAQDGPASRLAAGISVIPQDRRNEGLVLPWSLAENAILGDQRRRTTRGGWILDGRAANVLAREIVARFDVRAQSVQAPVATLSGGNQQKVVVGRALLRNPAFVLAYQPTRGIDVGAAALVQSRLIEARNAGAAVLLISFELDEVFALADRILVMFRGAIVGEFGRDESELGHIGRLMAGTA